MQNGNRRDRNRKKEEREGYKEIDGAEHIYIIRDYKSFIFFNICLEYEPIYCNSSKTIMIQIFNEYIMVNCIKSFFQVNKNSRNIFVIVLLSANILYN